MSREAEALRALLPECLEVTATGLGIQRSVPWLLARFRREKPELLLFTGSAGQLDLSLELGDLVLPRSWSLEPGGPCFDCHLPSLERLRRAGFPVAAKGLTLARPVAKAEQRRELHASTEAVIFDAVTAAVVRVAATAGVPCLTPKIVANTARSGLTAFWSRLTDNLKPLGGYLEKVVEVLEADDSLGLE